MITFRVTLTLIKPPVIVMTNPKDLGILASILEKSELVKWYFVLLDGSYLTQKQAGVGGFKKWKR